MALSLDWLRLPFRSNRSAFLWACVVSTVLVDGGMQSFAEPKKAVRKEVQPVVGDAAAPAAGEFEEATFGAGCFWCSEAVFQQLKGVKTVVSGYSGGRTKYPTYEEVSSGSTGHAEVIHVTFDPDVITFEELLEVFWKTHDPTTRNRQGPDHGTQYRSVVFYHNDTQKKLAEEYRKKLNDAKAFKKPIVTEISQFKVFYPGEDYHQNYFRNHPDQPYCESIIQHKVEKFREVFKDKIETTPRP